MASSPYISKKEDDWKAVKEDKFFRVDPYSVWTREMPIVNEENPEHIHFETLYGAFFGNQKLSFKHSYVELRLFLLTNS